MTAPATPPAPVVGPNLDQTQLAVQIASLLRKNNGEPDKVIELLLADNTAYRERHRVDTETITELKKKVPADGAIVLVGEEAKSYTALKELKLTPDQIKTLQTEHGDLKTKVTEQEYKALVGQAAGDAYNADTLYDLLGMKGQRIVMKEMIVPDEKDKTKTVKKNVPHVRKASDDKAAEEDLKTYVERELKGYELALRKAAGGTSDVRGGRSTVSEFPSQTTSTTTGKVPGSGAEVVQRHIADRYQPPSALTAGAKKE